MDLDQAERAWRARADLVIGVVLWLLGLAVVYGSWTMPRLEQRHIHPSTIPGLVPGLLGIGLVFCSAMLTLKALRTPAPGGWAGFFGIFPTLAGARVTALVVMVLIHTLGLVGRIPFWAAGALFIFSFICVFELWLTSNPKPWKSTLAWAVGIGLGAGIGIHYVFERIFLVRLP